MPYLKKKMYHLHLKSVNHRINQGLWRSFEEGKITKDVLLDTRFGLLFDAFNRS